MSPRDFYKADTTGLVLAARVYSNVVSPPVMFALIGLAICLYTLPLPSAVTWFLVYGFWVSLFPILFVVFLLYTGRVEELHMSNTRERRLPYVVAFLGSAIAFGLITWFEGPELLRCLTIFNMVELITLALINLAWLISLHSTGAMAASTLISVIWGLPTGLLIGIPLTVSVCWVRLYLRRHTVAQTVVGLGVGMFTVLILIPFGCFTS